MAYPQFKQGIKELQEDAVLITQAVNMETIFIAQAKGCDRLRLEKRKGIVGRAQELLYKIDDIRIAAESSNLPDTKEKSEKITQLHTKMSNLRKDLTILSEKIADNETLLCITEGLKIEFEKTPPEFAWSKVLDKSRTNNTLSTMLIEQDSEKYIGYKNHSESYKNLRRLIQDDLNQLIRSSHSKIAKN